MSVFGIVAASILSALFLFALLACAALAAWQGWQNKRLLSAAQRETEQVYAETKSLLVANQAETKATIESAKGAFGAIRTDVRALLEDHRKEIRVTIEEFRKELAATLDGHRQQTQTAIDKINAEALVSVAARLTQVCLRAEKAVVLLQSLVLDTEARVTNEYGPNDFAPEDSPFGTPPSGYSVSQTAALDEQSGREEVGAGQAI